MLIATHFVAAHLGSGGVYVLAAVLGVVDVDPFIMGMTQSTSGVTSLAVAGVPRQDTGVASALLNASQQVGGALGIALMTAVAAARFDTVRPRHPTPATLAAATTSSWVWGFVVGALLLVGAAVTTVLLVRPERETRHSRVHLFAPLRSHRLRPPPFHAG